MSETQVSEPTEVAPPEPLVQPLLKKIVRERYLSQKYSPYEFVLLIDGESLDVMKKLCCMKGKISGSKPCKKK